MRKVLLLLLFGMSVPAAASLPDIELRVDHGVASGFASPIYLTHAGDGSGRLFVVEQGGRIRIIEPSGTVLPTPFLDISGIVNAGGERGLLGLAFPPDYETEGLFYVYYTDLSGTSVLARYSVSGDPDVADPSSRTTLLNVLQPFANHNGGQLAFGPLDGYLYVGLGDGGSGNDPLNHGQNPNTLLGSILRIDVSTPPYAVPADNPFVGGPGLDEIWATGVRNPWRFSFDRETGDLYIGDVGQGSWEEISYQRAGTPGGLNFGWAVREGPCPAGQPMPCAPAPAPYVDPIAFYDHGAGRSVTGGYLYRGTRFPALVGRYFYADFVTGVIWSLYATGPGTWSNPELELRAGVNVSSFGEDEDGELYLLDYFGGTVRRLEDAIDAPAILSDSLPDGFVDVPYAEAIDVAGGTPPYTFELVSGSLAPGLSGPDPATGVVSGIPTTLGAFGPITVRVTDATTRFVEADLTHLIALTTPAPLSPSGAISDATPTFSWTSTPRASEYELIVEADDDGSVLVDASGLGTTSFTPGAALPSEELLRWRVRASDGLNSSAFSTDTFFEIDLTPPGIVTDLSAAPAPTYIDVAETASDSSSDANEIVGKSKATDGNPTTFWSTAPRTTFQNEFLTIDLGEVRTIGRVRLLPRDVSGVTFPRDFEIQTSQDGVSYTTVRTVLGLNAVAATEYAYTFGPVDARYLRIFVTDVTPYFGDGLYYTQIAEVDVDRAEQTPGELLIQWSAPGDDGGVQPVVSYDLRWSLDPIDEGGFTSASPVPGVGSPGAIGALESIAFSGLDDETLYFFALKSTDDAGNVSALSNLAQAWTFGTAPSPVTDLAASSPQLDSVDLAWTATGDDGTVGTATTYDLRFATSPITETNFQDATSVPSGTPAPGGAGSPESATVTGLSSATTYYFALRVVDEAGNASLLSNVVTATTLDGVPPAAVNDLAAQALASSFVPLNITSVTARSGAPAVADRNTIDGNASTFWSTPPEPTVANEPIEWDLGGLQSLSRLRLRARADFGGLFPATYDVQVKGAGDFVTVASASSVTLSNGEWIVHDFPLVDARWVRLLISEARVHSDGFRYVQIAEAEICRAIVAVDSVELSWTAPGDDGVVGTASSYDLRRSKSVITELNFESATRVIAPAPASPGSLETVLAGGLEAETDYYFAVKAIDDVNNSGPISNVAAFQTPTVPPAPVVDLVAMNPTPTSIQLAWTASGDDGSVGQASNYDIRVSQAPITSANFESATPIVTHVPTPAASGTVETMTVEGLSPATGYVFAMRVIDDVGAVSGLSNSAAMATIDNVPPDAITDLEARPARVTQTVVSIASSSSGDGATAVGKDKSVDGSLTTFWSTPARSSPVQEHLILDTGANRRLVRVRLRTRDIFGGLFPEDFEIQVSGGGSTFTTVASRTGFVGRAATWYDFDFAPTFARYVRVLVTKPRRYTGDGSFYTQIAEVEVVEEVDLPGVVQLQWTAPVDAGLSGTAESYDMRLSTVSITPASFDTDNEVLPSPAPLPAGSTMTHRAASLNNETELFFAVKSSDGLGNPSPISNVASAFTPGTPPASIDDLQASNLTSTSLDLSWTATGDDGDVGIATSYDIRISTAPLDSSNIDSASSLEGPTPSASGIPESFTVNGLSPGVTYFLGVRAFDEAGNASPLSNVVSATTIDAVPPDAVTDLSATLGSTILRSSSSIAVGSSADGAPAVSKEMAADGDPATFWSTPPRAVEQVESLTLDTGSERLLARVDLLSRDVFGGLFPEDVSIQVSSNGVDYSTIHSVSGLPTAKATWTRIDLPAPTIARFVRVLTTNARRHTDGKFYVQIADVVILESLSSVTLSWTAPGDDGSVGTAAVYDLRYSTSPITSENFSAAVPVMDPPAPMPAGAAEAVELALTGGETYYFALITFDDAGGASGLSNVPELSIP